MAAFICHWATPKMAAYVCGGHTQHGGVPMVMATPKMAASIKTRPPKMAALT